MEPQQPTVTPTSTNPVAPVAAPEPPAPVATPSPVAPAPVTPVAPLPPAAGKKGLPTWLKIVGTIIAVLVAFVVIVGIFANQATKGAAKVGDQFVASIQEDKPNEGYQLAAPAFKQATSESDFSSMVHSASPALQGPVSKTGNAISKKSGQPNLATLTYSIKTGKGTMYIRINLQDNHPWQVYNFESSPTKLELDN